MFNRQKNRKFVSLLVALFMLATLGQPFVALADEDSETSGSVSYSVFLTAEGKEFHKVAFVEGMRLSAISAPHVEGAKFSYWHLSGSAGSSFDFNQTLSRPVKLVPKYKPVETPAPAFYCRSCDEYYLQDYDYLRAKAQGGVLLCRLIHEKQYEQECKGDFANLAPKSILNLCGYNVNKLDDLSEAQRQYILDRVIGSRVLTLMKVRSHISWLIKGGRRNYRYAEAVSKWEADLKYLQDKYHDDGRRVRVGSITTKW